MLAALLNTPKSNDDWNRWSFHHRQSHALIRQAIQQQHQIGLNDFIIDPISFDQAGGWLENNQQLHTDMNGVLNKQSVDMEDLDFKNERQVQAWMYLHYQEHLTAEDALGIRS